MIDSEIDDDCCVGLVKENIVRKQMLTHLRTLVVANDHHGSWEKVQEGAFYWNSLTVLAEKQIFFNLMDDMK